VVKAIRDSPLSLNPTNEGNEVLVKLPRLTKDTIGAAAMYNVPGACAACDSASVYVHG
jgi:hypothetical protein